MADLYNLLGELDEQQQQQLDGQQLENDQLQEDFASPKADSQVDNDDDDDPAAATANRRPHDNNDNDDDNDDDQYRERLDLPPALAEAARFQKSKKTNTNSSSTPATVRMSMETQTTANTTSSTRHNDDDDNNEPLSLEDLMRDDYANNQNGGGGLYSKLDHWWVQELHSPELLPYNDAIVDEMLHSLEMAEQQQQNNNNATRTGNTSNLDMNAMLSSIFQIDKERVQFVLSHLIKIRLQKIQQQAWFIAREQTDRLSQRELLFLQEYGLLLEGHLQQAVTNHFPKEAWKALDEPHMISPPVDWLEGYVFCHVKESCTIDNGTSSSSQSQLSQDNDDDDDEDEQQALQYHKAGDCIIVRYHKIRPLLEEGKVELLM